ncbi:uncharacterized protein LOC143245347 [Tachypleus tridentatus]|uniref:uncharacterized protein LOC143245347 n=1 Tax=Tachypleus tridentatus TaxID=6853 RepID=UPI003FD1F720
MMMLRCHRLAQLTSLTTDLTLPVNSHDIFSVNVDASCSTRQSEVEIIAKNENLLDFDKILQSSKDEETTSNDPGLWLHFSADDVAYWIACGLPDYQHHIRPFGNLVRLLIVAN